MVNPQDVEAVIRKMAEARDEALWKVLYFKCQRCGEIKPIAEAVGVESPQEDGRPLPEIWCKSCFAEMLLT
ncbi:MAG: hypothetical protein ACE5LQ_01990 [Candidatus Bipolaricaulia bacterium]